MSSLLFTCLSTSRKCVLFIVIITLIKVQEATENSGYDDGDDDDGLTRVENVGLNLKQEACKEDFEDFHDDVFYTAEEQVCGDKRRVLDWGDFDGDDMVDIPFNELEFEEKAYVNYDIRGANSLKLANPLHGSDNYVGSYVNNILIDSFKWLPNFSLHLSTSTNPRLVKEGNSLKIGGILKNQKN